MDDDKNVAHDRCWLTTSTTLHSATKRGRTVGYKIALLQHFPNGEISPK
jgi:hypothetical protein